MAEAQNATNLQMAEAQGEMDVQKLKGEGSMWSTDKEIGKATTQMDMQMRNVQMQSAEANAPKDKGFLGGLFSDERLKENITKVKHSHSGIPIYHFNYKGGNTTWSGTMAQDLLRLGRQDAVTTAENGYYKVDYNLIDIDMKRVKPSPLKKVGGEQAKDQAQANKGMMSAGMDILAEAARRKNWEEIQQEALDIEPESMQIRKLKDARLRDQQKEELGDNAVIKEVGIDGVGNASKYTASLLIQLEELQEILYEAIMGDDEKMQGEIKTRLAMCKTTMTRYREETQIFFENHFAPDSYCSKSGSKQQLSFGTQIYCKNPDLIIVHATEEDVMGGRLDAYDDPLVEDMCYGIVENFSGQHVLVAVVAGNKNVYWINANRAMEYIGYVKEYSEKAVEARNAKSVSKIDLGGINYKMDLFFGSNDGTATKTQDRLVAQFCWDTHLLRDGSSFRRHLYEHPNIENLNYGGFDFENMKFSLDLGPGDTNYWHDNIDGMDKLKLVDAICNVDNPFFDMKLLRTLVKEYYTYRIENAWWKGMGYEEGRLEIMRLKQKELTKQRFAMDKAKAAEDGLIHFTFDGAVYPTGMTKAKVKQMEDERGKAAEQANPQLNK